jgi:putative intracellular protease/amidase
MSPLPKRALIAITSTKAPLSEGNTGVFISEAQHPYNVFRAAGFEVDIASKEGKWSADNLSVTSDFMNDEDRKQ